MYHNTLWHVHITTAAMEMQQCSLFLVVGTYVAVNNTSVQCCHKCNNGFHLHCCWATKYLINLLKIISIKYYEWVSRYYNVSNQRDTTTFSFINLFNSALLILGDKFAHPREHFLTVYAAFGKMHWHCCWPVGSSVGALYQKLYIQSKRAPEDGRICHPKHVGLN
jgi:hypothetical protein